MKRIIIFIGLLWHNVWRLWEISQTKHRLVIMLGGDTSKDLSVMRKIIRMTEELLKRNKISVTLYTKRPDYKK